MKIAFKAAENEIPVGLERDGENFIFTLRDRSLSGRVCLWDPPRFKIKVGDEVFAGEVFRRGDKVDVHLPAGTFRLNYFSKAGATAGHVAAGGLTAPMPAKIVKVLVKEGDAVRGGEELMILEAMKMEYKIFSPLSGSVKKIFFREGDKVSQDVQLLEIVE
jgi:3-methylcrotonyl-CoA carboxylase alpha subunit